MPTYLAAVTVTQLKRYIYNHVLVCLIEVCGCVAGDAARIDDRNVRGSSLASPAASVPPTYLAADTVTQPKRYVAHIQ